MDALFNMTPHLLLALATILLGVGLLGTQGRLEAHIKATREAQAVLSRRLNRLEEAMDILRSAALPPVGLARRGPIASHTKKPDKE